MRILKGSFVQHLDAMYVGDGAPPNTLVFRINLGTPGAVEQAGFVHYLHEKFDGRRTAIERYYIAPHYRSGRSRSNFQTSRPPQPPRRSATRT